MQRKMIKYHGPVENKIQEMPQSQTLAVKSLKDFIGNDSWIMLKIVSIDPNFLNLNVVNWDESDS